MNKIMNEEALREKELPLILQKTNMINKMLSELEERLEPILVASRPSEVKEGEETSQVLAELEAIITHLNDIFDRLRL